MTRADFSYTASLMSDPGRAAMLAALLGDIALPAGELARVANVAPQTASSHLAKLVGGQLLTAEQQGRHRYYRLANAEVANAIEALLALTPGAHSAARVASPKPADGLAFARTCYNHLAGEVAVALADILQRRHLIVAYADKSYALSDGGRSWFQKFGIAIRPEQERQARFARGCLDWTERRHHLAGYLGAQLLRRLRELRWIAPVRNTRAVRVTLEGEKGLAAEFGVRLPRR